MQRAEGSKSRVQGRQAGSAAGTGVPGAVGCGRPCKEISTPMVATPPSVVRHAQPAPGRLHSLHAVRNNKRQVDLTLSTKKRSASGMPSTTSPCRSSRVDCSRKSVTWQRSRARQAKTASETGSNSRRLVAAAPLAVAVDMHVCRPWGRAQRAVSPPSARPADSHPACPAGGGPSCRCASSPWRPALAANNCGKDVHRLGICRQA